MKNLRPALPLLAALLSAVAAAAEPADHLNVQEPARPEYLPAKPGKGFELPPVAPAKAPAAAAGMAPVQVDRVAFRGNAAVGSDELERVAAPYVGRRLDEAGLEELRQKLTRHYVDRGYVNSGALLGKDAVMGDTVTFDIVEGRLSMMRLRGLERLSEDYVAKRLVRDGDLALNVDTLRERFQLLLDDPLFERLNARLMPGAKLGEAVLDIDAVRARPYQLTFSTNNYRPPSIGAAAYGFSGWVRNLTGWGDVLDANVQDAMQGGTRGRYGIGWRLPLGAVGTQLSLQVDHGQSSVIEQPMQTLDIKSTLDSHDLGLSQVFVESLRHKLTLGVNYAERENRTTMQGQPFSFTPGEPNGITRVSAWRFWQEYAFRTETHVLALRSTFTAARNNLQDIAGLPGAAPQPDHHYTLWLGQVQFARQVLDNGAQAVVRGSLQQTGRMLVALDRFSIGGANTVRGYRENQLIRDRGHVVNLEFDYPLVKSPGKDLNLALIPFYDQGRGQNRYEAPATLSSWGVAARARWQGLSLDVAIANRLVHPGSVTTGGGTFQDKGIHVQLAYNFF